MHRLRTCLLLLALTVGAPLMISPARAAAQSHEEMSMESRPEANPADVESIDTIIAALYDVISGPAGQTRDWDRFRSLFVPEARLIPTGMSPSGEFGHQILSADEFVSNSAPFMEERGFFEIETARTTERFGQIAHVFSTYDSRWKETDAEPFDRGINSIQLLFDGERWAILNIFWAAERADLSIPERYTTSRP